MTRLDTFFALAALLAGCMGGAAAEDVVDAPQTLAEAGTAAVSAEVAAGDELAPLTAESVVNFGAPADPAAVGRDGTRPTCNAAATL